MSHHRLLTPAARPRPGTPPAARRLPLILLVFLSLAAGAPFAAAEMIYYTEDFFNDGEPGFDPMFIHEFIEPSGYPDYMYPLWNIRAPIPGLVEEYWLAMAYGTRDVITFNLEGHDRVASAAVTLALDLTSLAYVKFIGTRGEWQTSTDQHGQRYFEVSSRDLGYIQAIELSERQGGVGFAKVRIGVIPEPTIPLLAICIFLCLLSVRSHKNNATSS